MRLALLIALLALAAPQTAPPVFKAAIEGVVRDGSTNQPLAGVRVYIVDASQFQPLATTPSVTTDAQGTFALPVSSPGRYRVLPQRNEFVYARPARLQSIQAGVVVSVVKESVSKIELAMVREGIIAGQILDPTGMPLAGVTVNLLVRTYYSGSGTLGTMSPLGALGIRPAITNDRGEYRYFGLQPGDYIIATPGALASSTRFYPGVEDLARAALIQVNSGEEKRLPPMTVTDRNKVVPVHFRYKDPEGKFRNKGFNLGNSVASFFIGWGNRGPVEPEIVLPLARGHYEFTLRASSDDNDLLYAPVKVDVGNEELFLDADFKPGLRVTGSLKLEDSAGKTLEARDIQCFLEPEVEGATAQSKAPGCIGGQVSPGVYRLSMSRMPPDAYVVSARSGDRNVLADGIQIDRDTPLDILLSTPGSVIDGIVTDDKGEPLFAAVIALIPEAPLRKAVPLYRSDITTHDGSFELRGIAPGSYRLLAWPDLPGDAYLNGDFMSAYEGQGAPVHIDAAKHLSMTVKIVE